MDDEIANPVMQAQMAELDASIREKIGDSIPDNEVDEDLAGRYPEIPDDIFLDERENEYDPAEPEAAMPEADDYTPEAYDEYLTAEVLLPNMGTMTKVKVKGRKRDADGNPIRLRNNNPILDTRQYKSNSLMERPIYLQRTRLPRACIR
jgi:hypothetical protein